MNDDIKDIDALKMDYEALFAEAQRMDIFGLGMVDVENEKDIDPSIFNEEFSSMLYQNSTEVDVKKAYSGLLPEISGNCDNIINKVLTMKDVDLTDIGKSFFMSNLLEDVPKDENSKKLYASVMNQLVCYNILNVSRKELYGSCTLKLIVDDAPAWFKLEQTCKMLVYILRERKMNSLALKRSEDCDLFIETFSRDITKRDEIKSSIDYIKLIIKGDVAESKYHTIVVRVKSVIDVITKELFKQKMEPMQQRLFDAEEYWTKLEAIDDEVKHLEYIEDSRDKLREGYNLTLSALKLCSEVLTKLGKYSDIVEKFETLTELYGICVPSLEGNYQDSIICLNKNFLDNFDFVSTEDSVILENYLNKDIKKLMEEIFVVLERYKNAHLYLDMTITQEEILDSQKADEEDEETIG